MWRLYNVTHDEAVLGLCEGEGCPIPWYKEMHDVTNRGLTAALKPVSPGL